MRQLIIWALSIFCALLVALCVRHAPPDLTSPGGARAPLAGRSMAAGIGPWQTAPLLTVGELISGTTGAYAPPGALDGLGAFLLDANTVRLLANHELGYDRAYDYAVSDGGGGSFTLDGARISYFDIDRYSRQIVAAGPAISLIYDATGAVATDNSFLANNRIGFDRFCSSQLVEPLQFGGTRGLEDRIYFAGEEAGGAAEPVGGGEWALDPVTGDFWHLPALGRGAWENVTVVDTMTTTHVALVLADDTAPFDADGDGLAEAAPLFLYTGEKNGTGDFPARNGLRNGQLFVWVSDSGERTPLAFNGAGTLAGTWIAVDNTPRPGEASEDGSTGYDEWGYPTQRTLWTAADAAGAFGFSRPEDVATNPADGREIVLASTGVDTYAVDGVTGNGADTFGTVYTLRLDLSDLANPTAALTILYDGDADSQRGLRSPDNLAWSGDGLIYVQEDKAEHDTLSGDEVLFGPGAANPNEAGIVRLHPLSGGVVRVANIDRSVVIDPSIVPETDAVDTAAGTVGAWESSGILDVAALFGADPGTLFLFDVQAHGIRGQTAFNPGSRIYDADLYEGGQLLWLQAAAHASYLPVAPSQ